LRKKKRKRKEKEKGKKKKKKKEEKPLCLKEGYSRQKASKRNHPLGERSVVVTQRQLINALQLKGLHHEPTV